MRISILMLVTLLTALVACRKNNDINPPRQEEVKLLSYSWNTSYSSGGGFTRSATIWIDSLGKTITTRYSGQEGEYEERFFDNSWRLIMIVNRNALRTGLIYRHEMDTLSISRQSGRVIVSHGKTARTSDGIISALPDGRRQVYYSGRIDQDNTLRFILNTRGLHDYEEVLSPLSSAYQNHRYYRYNTNGQLTSVEDTIRTGGGDALVWQHTIEKDNADNSVLTGIMKQMMGTDLDWMLNDRRMFDPFPFISEYPGIQLFQNGTLRHARIVSFKSADNINFMQDPAVVELNATNRYDTRGRLSEMNIVSHGGQITNNIQFTY
jgi:hypothetical protein